MLKLLIPQPAALIKSAKTRTLIIADPHLGWEMTLREKGIHVPSQTSRLTEKLTSLLTKYQPQTLLILGDVKYSVVASQPGEWHEINQFFTTIKRHVPEIGIVRGNHDANLEPMLPENIRLHPASGISINGIGLFHGHKWPSPKLLKCKTLLMGHLHPVVAFRDPAGFKITRQVWMKVKCDPEALAKTLLQKHGIKIEETATETLKKHYNFEPKTTQAFIMPSYNDFLGGRPVNNSASKRTRETEPLIGPLLRSKAVDVVNSELYLLDGTFLGTLNQLRTK